MFHVRCISETSRSRKFSRERVYILLTCLNRDGDCLNDEDYSIMTFDVKDEDGALYLLLPPKDELDAILGTEKWM